MAQSELNQLPEPEQEPGSADKSNTPRNATQRRYDIDWLRVIAMWLLIIYHIGVAFQPFGGFIGFITNEKSLDYTWPAFQILNIWRIPLLFFISGMGVFFAMRRRNWHQLIGERSMTILVPLIYGSLAIVPLHFYLLQSYNGMPLQYFPNPGHLWFLINIYVYVLVLLPVFLIVKKYPENFILNGLRNRFGAMATVLAIPLATALTSLATNPASFAGYAMTSHGFILGLVCFFLGYLMIALGDSFQSALNQLKYPLLGVSAALYLVRLLHFGFEQTPNFLNGLECGTWVLTILAFGRQFLNRPGKLLSYLSPAVYPTYIFHMFAQYLGSMIIFKMEMAAELKFILLTIFTFVVAYSLYELLRRIKHLRPLIGLKL